MSSDESCVRTMAGWIGVEISRSRVRTAGKAGYGLYRVRTAAERHWHVPHPKVEADGEWTAYAFTLGEIERAIQVTIRRGRPAGLPPLVLVAEAGAPGPGVRRVPARWTSAYRGSRTLGVSEHAPATVSPDFSDQVKALAAAVGEGFEMRHVSYCVCEPPTTFTTGCVVMNRETVRSRQRAANAAFQVEHQAARDVGLARRHAAKLARNARTGNAADGPAAP